jgi:hypothetical protein
MWRTPLLAVAAAGWLASSPASAAVLCVTPGGGGGCFATIQAAVDAAAMDDIIDVAAGTYTENVVVGAGSRLTIQGAGAGATVVDGSGTGIVLQLIGPGTLVIMSGLTVQNGYDYGILMSSRARATLTAVDITANGGFSGITEFGGSRLTITASTIRDNNTHGIVTYARSRLHLISSTVSGNAYNGVFGVEAFVSGGVPAPFVLIEDSTISGNGTAALSGSDLGIAGGSLRILRSTITENVGLGLHGPSIRGVKPKLSATILSNNGGGDCGETIRSKGYNFVGTACAAYRTGAGSATDLIGDDPMLGPLQDNGGPTPTHEPAVGSPVLEVVNTLCKEPDQRSVSRLPAPCDVGAVEAP